MFLCEALQCEKVLERNSGAEIYEQPPQLFSAMIRSTKQSFGFGFLSAVLLVLDS